MAPLPLPSDPVAAGEATRLYDIRKKVEQNISKLEADQINPSQICATKEKLKDILEIAEEYGFGMTMFLERNPNLEETICIQYKADLDKFHELVDDFEFVSLWDGL